MATETPVSFPHRHNLDGSWDSICPNCYATIATTADESELSAFERVHDCAECARELNRGLYFSKRSP